MTARNVRVRVAAAAGAVLGLLGLQLTIGAVPASAEGSQIAFVTASPVQTAFGGNWNVQLSTRFAFQPSVAIPADQATVDVFLSGIEGTFATHLPIQPDGSVYVSQSAATTLPPGEYQMTATLVPVPGSFVEGSQTTTPLVLTITSYAVDAEISIDQGSVADGEPVIEARLSGQFVEATEAVPAGTWAFTVAAKGDTVLEAEVAQDAGNDDVLRYAITEKLDKGVDYTVSASFMPVDALAAGLEVTQPDDVTFHTPDGGLADPVAYPLWLLIVTCLVPLALAIAVVVLTVRIGKSAAPAAVTAPTVEIVNEMPAEWDPFPLQNAAAEPVQPTQVQSPQYPPTQVQPQNPPVPPQETPTERIEPSGWTLSDDPAFPRDPNDPR
ncbi:MAG: hypothetical protein ABI566_06310 [Pseudolysinimonas sp.]